MKLVQKEINKRKQEIEQAKEKKIKEIRESFPAEINCQKCDGPNPFDNEVCMFCGSKLDKSEYEEMLLHLDDCLEKSNEQESELGGQEVSENGNNHSFEHIISFLIPLVGFILGAILLSKEDVDEKEEGKTCIVLGICSMIVSMLVFVFLL